MPRRCTICDHPQRQAIEKALISGQPYRALARAWKVTPSALVRHYQRHLSALLTQAQQDTEATAEAGSTMDSDVVRHQQAIEQNNALHAIDVIHQLKAINAACLEVLGQARKDSQPTILLRAVDRIYRQIELQARLLGEIQDEQQVNVSILPEWAGIRQRILAALEPFPEARLAVAEALRHVDP